MDAPLLTAKEAIELRDGRRLSYSATGPTDGVPVLYFHGVIGAPPICGSSLRREILHSRVRYLMVDRPGFGGSDLHPGRTLLDFADDVRELADALGFRRFSVLGVSCGAPYALACARAMPERVAAVASVSTIPSAFSPRRSRGSALWVRALLMLVRGRPAAVRAIMDRLIELARRRPRVLRALFSVVVRRDRGRPGERSELTARRFLGTIARGSDPMIQDFLICCSPWGFDPSDVIPPVHLWHGVRDPVAPVAEAHRLARRLPDRSVRFPDEGHLFLRNRVGDVLRPLAVAAAAGDELEEVSPRLAA